VTVADRKFLLLCALVFLAGCGKKKEGVIVVTPADVLEAAKGPAGEGNRRWKGRVLQVTGPVKDVGDISLTLIDPDTGVFVVCYLKVADPGLQGKLAPGQRIAVRGRCASAVNLAVDLKDCEVIP
jgi:hypothetical protein